MSFFFPKDKLSNEWTMNWLMPIWNNQFIFKNFRNSVRLGGGRAKWTTDPFNKLLFPPALSSLLECGPLISIFIGQEVQGCQRFLYEPGNCAGPGRVSYARLHVARTFIWRFTVRQYTHWHARAFLFMYFCCFCCSSWTKARKYCWPAFSWS